MLSLESVGCESRPGIVFVFVLQEFVGGIRLRVVVRHYFQIALIKLQGILNLMDGSLRGLAFQVGKGAH